MATYLVTGGAGFIGSHIAALALEQGHKVIVLDDLSTGSLANIADIMHHAHFTLIEGNICLPQLLLYCHPQQLFMVITQYCLK